MIDAFEQWLIDLPKSQTYQLFVGEWVESNQDADKFYLMYRQDGGPAPGPDIRWSNVGVILVGRRNKRSDAEFLKLDANAIIEAAIAHEVIPKCSVIVNALGEPVGPGFTTEGRAFYQLNLQVIF